MKNKGIYVYMGREEEDQKIIDLIDSYRRLTGMNWKGFILSAVADYIARDNEALAMQIVEYMMQGRRK